MDPDRADSRLSGYRRLMAARREFDAQAARFVEVRTRLQTTMDLIQSGRSRSELVHDSAYARLQAGLASMPVIEQAKGIVMVQNQCGPDEAFDLLRRASQSANIKVSVLAALLVEQVTSPPSGRNVQRARSAAWAYR